MQSDPAFTCSVNPIPHRSELSNSREGKPFENTVEKGKYFLSYQRKIPSLDHDKNVICKFFKGKSSFFLCGKQLTLNITRHIFVESVEQD